MKFSKIIYSVCAVGSVLGLTGYAAFDGSPNFSPRASAPMPVRAQAMQAYTGGPSFQDVAALNALQGRNDIDTQRLIMSQAQGRGGFGEPAISPRDAALYNAMQGPSPRDVALFNAMQAPNVGGATMDPLTYRILSNANARGGLTPQDALILSQIRDNRNGLLDLNRNGGFDAQDALMLRALSNRNNFGPGPVNLNRNGIDPRDAFILNQIQGRGNVGGFGAPDASDYFRAQALMGRNVGGLGGVDPRDAYLFNQLQGRPNVGGFGGVDASDLFRAQALSGRGNIGGFGTPDASDYFRAQALMGRNVGGFGGVDASDLFRAQALSGQFGSATPADVAQAQWLLGQGEAPSVPAAAYFAN